VRIGVNVAGSENITMEIRTLDFEDRSGVAGSESITMEIRTIGCEDGSGWSWLRKYYNGD
jgi:hypothetical protein